MKDINKLFIIVACAVCLGLGFNWLLSKQPNDLSITKSPLASTSTSFSTVSPNPTENIQTKANFLKNVVNDALVGTIGTYGIVIKNFKTGETYYANEHIVFDPASLYKLWVMATVYDKIQSGQLQENQILHQDVTTLNQEFDIATDSAEQTEGTVTYTVYDALTQMITVSDNYAALLLSEKIRLSSVAIFLKENGFIESTVGTTGGPPTSTPYDIARFLEKLYKGELADTKYTNEMVNLLKDQKLTGGIPKYLPDALNIANKTGEIDDFKHDAGIVYADTGDYIIVVMSESDNPLGAQERIALISKAIFDYFTNK